MKKTRIDSFEQHLNIFLKKTGPEHEDIEGFLHEQKHGFNNNTTKKSNTQNTRYMENSS